MNSLSGESIEVGNLPCIQSTSIALMEFKAAKNQQK